MQAPMSQIVWVTGARGFIGRHVAKHLASTGSVVHGVGHGIWPLQARVKWGLSEWVDGDISASNLSALAALGGKPAVVMHLAGGFLVGFSVAQPRGGFTKTVLGAGGGVDLRPLSGPPASLVAG